MRRIKLDAKNFSNKFSLSIQQKPNLTFNLTQVYMDYIRMHRYVFCESLIQFYSVQFNF